MLRRPLPQTRYVSRKPSKPSSPHGRHQQDRPSRARVQRSRRVYDLFIDLDADEDMLDSRPLHNGKSAPRHSTSHPGVDLQPLLSRSSRPSRRQGRSDGRCRSRHNLDYSDYSAARHRPVFNGTMRTAKSTTSPASTTPSPSTRSQALRFSGLKRTDIDQTQTATSSPSRHSGITIGESFCDVENRSRPHRHRRSHHRIQFNVNNRHLRARALGHCATCATASTRMLTTSRSSCWRRLARLLQGPRPRRTPALHPH